MDNWKRERTIRERVCVKSKINKMNKTKSDETKTNAEWMNYKDRQFWAILAKLRHKDQNYKCLLSYLSHGPKSNQIISRVWRKWRKQQKETQKVANARHQSASTTRQSMNFSWAAHTHTHPSAHSNISISFGLCGIFVMIYLFVFTCVRKIIDKRRIVWLSSSFMKNDCIRNNILDSINHHHHRHSGESHAHSHTHIIRAKTASSSIIQTCVPCTEHVQVFV